MKTGESLSILSHLINFGILIHFTVYLIKLNSLDVIGLGISAFGVFISLIANILSIVGK